MQGLSHQRTLKAPQLLSRRGPEYEMASQTNINLVLTPKWYTIAGSKDVSSPPVQAPYMYRMRKSVLVPPQPLVRPWLPSYHNQRC